MNNSLDLPYEAFRTTYKWMLKTYPGTAGIFHRDTFYTERLGAMCTQKYTKNASGRWILDKATTEDFTAFNYCNTVDAMPFFRGMGGTERAMLGYTKHGYMPIEITSISPDKQSRTVRTFKFC